MSLLRTIRPLEQATIRSRVGRTSQSFTTAAFTVLVRAGAGSRPYRRRHALGESDCSLHIARSFEKSRCPWLLSPSNKALATAPFPSGMVGRFPEAPISRSTRKAGLTDGQQPHRTTQQHDATVQNPPQFDPELIEVTDPAHPLYGRRFQVMSISHPPQHPGHVIVAYRDCLRLRIPVQATERNPDNATRSRTRFTRDALLELLALLKECPTECADLHGPSGTVSPTP